MADPLDVVTMSEAVIELGEQDETTLAAYITAVSQLLDEACGPIVERTISGETHDGGVTVIDLRWAPVASVSTVTEYQGVTPVVLTGETATTAPAAGFLVDGESGRVWRRAGKQDAVFAGGRQSVSVTYVAGRYEDTTTVDARFKRAALITLRNLWAKEQGFGTVTFGPDGQPIVGATFAIPYAAEAFIRGDLVLGGFA